MIPYAAYCGAKEARRSLKSYMAKRKSLKEAKKEAKRLSLLAAEEKDGKKVDDDALTVSTDVTSITGDESVADLPMERPEWWVGEWPPKEEAVRAACCGQCEKCRAAGIAAPQGLQTCPEEPGEEEYYDARERPAPALLPRDEAMLNRRQSTSRAVVRL